MRRPGVSKRLTQANPQAAMASSRKWEHLARNGGLGVNLDDF